MRPRRIEMYLPELVLEGVDARDRDRVVAALERELTRHVARGEHPRASRDTVVAERPAGLGPAELGAHVARAIAKGGER
jgi:hypothetical protein